MFRRFAVCLLVLSFVCWAGCADLASSSQRRVGDPTPRETTKLDRPQTLNDREAGAEESVGDVSAVVDGNNRFACDLYQQLRQERGNLFYSPASISLALAMTYAGAAGLTETEMANTLHFTMPKGPLDAAMATWQTSLQTPSKEHGYRLNVANRLWGQQSYGFLPEFLDVTRTQYGAELARVDFDRDRETARLTINAWVEDQTENKITNLIPSEDMLVDARLVLTNAVYFQGDWSNAFDKDATQEADFHLTSSRATKVPLMRHTGKYRYTAADGVRILELPYGDGSLSMVVVLPETIDGLSDVEATLTPKALRTWSDTMSSRTVAVYLPRFTTTCEFGLNEALKSMGMVSAFDEHRADFSGMTDEQRLFISAVLHKAFVDVDETGTEAAAATGVVMVPVSASPDDFEPPVFRADRPFVFFIRDNRNGAIIFLGRVVDPTT